MQAQAQGVVVEGVDLRAGDHFGAFAQPDLAGDRARGDRVVAGQHDDAHPCTAAFGDRGGHFRAWRIDEPHQAQEAEREVVLALRPCAALPLAAGHAQHAQATCGHRLHPAEDRRRLGGGQVTQVDHRLGRTLGRQQVLRARLAAEHAGHREDVG